MIEVASRPTKLAIDAATTAVLVIDMQNDFGARGGMFDRAGIDISGIAAAVATTSRVLAAAREAGFPIIYVKMEHPADLANVGPLGQAALDQAPAARGRRRSPCA